MKKLPIYAMLIALFAAGAQAQTYVIQASSGTSGKEMKGFSTDFYTAVTWKLNARYNFTPELMTNVEWVSASPEKNYAARIGVSHSGLRFSLSDKDLMKLGSQQFTANWFYVAPTTAGAQKAGTKGNLVFRPSTQFTPGGFTLMFRLPIGMTLTDEQTEINVEDPNKKGVTLGYFAEEFIFSTPDLGIKDFVFNLYWQHRNSYVGNHLGKPHNRIWNGYIAQEYSFGYKGAPLENYDLELGAGNESTYGKAQVGATPGKISLWKPENQYVFFKLTRAF